MKLRDYQVRAIDALRNEVRQGHRSVVLVAPTGCHATGQGILLFDGTIKPVEKIETNDLLMGPDSTPRVVNNLIHGSGEMYRIIPKKGQPFVVNLDHVLTLIHTEKDTLIDVTVREWLGWNKWKKHCHKLKRADVEFALRKILPLEPYFLGLLLGDGCLSRGVAVAKPGNFIKEEVQRQSQMHGLKVRTDGTKNNPVHHLTQGLCGGKKNVIWKKLQDIGLAGCRSGDKFIPTDYLTSSRNDRLDLLAGIVDTDGHVSKGGVDYISKSKRLAENVVYLARSVGLAAYLSESEKYCQAGAGGIYYRVYISGDCSIIPCRRNKATPRRQIKDVTREGFKIEHVGYGEFFGFTLDRDGRYLLDDFTITHNSGKTVLACELIRTAIAKGSSVLFVAHRREILSQTSRKLDALDIPHGWIMAGMQPSFMPQVQLASIQTLSRRTVPKADIVVWDECAHNRAATYEKVKAQYPDAIHLGLTATPCRADGRGLGNVFDKLIQPVTYAELLESGYLVPTVCYAPPGPDLSGVRIRAGDYIERDLEEALDKPKLVGDIVAHWEHHARNRRTLVFAVTVAHALHLCEAFNNSGHKFEELDGETDSARRAATIARLENGELDGIVNVGLFTEGTDVPAVSCIVLGRPTKSFGLYRQIVGRGLRPYPGKTDCLILDHADGIRMHGIPTSDVIWDLVSDSRAWKAPVVKDRKEPADWTCENCGFVNQASRSPYCLSCGERAMKLPQGLAVEDGHLIRVDAQTPEKPPKPREYTMEQKGWFFAELRSYARSKGYRDGWVANQYRQKFGVWPNHPEIRQAANRPTSPQTLAWIRSRQIAYAKASEKGTETHEPARE